MDSAVPARGGWLSALGLVLLGLPLPALGQGTLAPAPGSTSAGVASSLAASGDRAYATVGDTLYASADAGQTWSRALSRQAVLEQNLRRIALVAAFGDEVYLRRGNAELFLSTDAGRAFVPFNAGLPPTNPLSDLVRVGDRALIISTGFNLFGVVKRVFRSPLVPGGQWSLVTTPDQFFSLTTVGTRLVAAGLRGVYTSDNLGETWTRSPGAGNSFQPAFISVRASGSRVTAIAEGEQGLAYLSLDGGLTFAPATPGLPEADLPADILAASPSRFYAAFILASTLRFVTSADGSAYTELPAAPLESLASLEGLALAGETLLLGTATGIARSTDAGTTFAPSNAGISSATNTLLAFTGPQRQTILAVDPVTPGLFRSTDGAQSFDLTPSDDLDNIATLLTVGDSRVFVGTVSRGVFASTDEGLTFSPASGVPGAGLPTFADEFGNPLFYPAGGLAERDGTILFASGITRQPTVDTPPGAAGEAVGAGIFRSTNNGLTWQPVSTGLPTAGVGLNGEQFFEPFTALNRVGDAYFAGAFLAGPVRSTDDGNTWEVLAAGLPLCFGGSPLAAGFARVDGGVLLATDGYGAVPPDLSDCGLPPAVFKLSDGDDFWTRSDTGLPDGRAVVSAIAASGREAFIALIARLPQDAAATGVYRTTDGGASWSRLEGLEGELPISLAAGPTTLLAGTAGAGIFTATIGCRADFDNNGILNPDDLSDFITEFFLTPPGPRADFDNNGITNPDDLADFIAAFFLGCN
jgi:photosystem II stability/assembly factor-like uncharacterized protein